MTSNHSSAYASNIVLDLEFTPAGSCGGLAELLASLRAQELACA